MNRTEEIRELRKRALVIRAMRDGLSRAIEEAREMGIEITTDDVVSMIAREIYTTEVER